MIKYIIFVISVVLLTLVIHPEAANGSSITCPAGAGEFQFSSGPEVRQHGEWVTVLCYYEGEIGIGSVELHYQESGTYTGTSHCKGEESNPSWRISTTHVADATNVNTFGVVDIQSLLSQVEQQDLAIRCSTNEDSLQDTGGSQDTDDTDEYCKIQLELCAEQFGLNYCKENVIPSAECDNQPATSIDKQTISSDKFFVDKQTYDATNGVTVKLWGELKQYERGVPIIIIITKPDGTQDPVTPNLSKSGNFEGYYKIGTYDPPGTYGAEAVYDDDIIGSLNFQVEKQKSIKSEPLEFDYEMSISSPDSVQAGDTAEYDIEVKKISGYASTVDIIIDENGISDSVGNHIDDWDFDGKTVIQVTPNPISNINLTITTTENTIPGIYTFVVVAFGGNIPTDGEFSLLVTKPEQKVSRWLTQEEKSRSIEELVSPTYDGSMETFEPNECKINSVPNNSPIYYINGQNNSPAEADKNAQLLADTLCRPVKRIYNLTSYSLFFDLIESVNLKIGSIDKTPAVETLYNNIYTDLSAGKSVELYGHSQGALIISNVLGGLQSVHPDLFAKNANKITVNTFGGASWFYPDGPKYHHNNFATDMVGLFTGRTPFNPFQVLLQTNPGPLLSDEKMLKIIPEPNFPGHAWVGYMKELPAFIIQHHLGLFDFNKKELGEDLLNYDPSLVLDVFYKLDDSDKADVAYNYLKNISEPELRQLPDQLRDVLENSLTKGKITPDEKKQLNRIISLRDSN